MVPDFDTQEPEPVGFRFLGRDWTCRPSLPDEALVVASIAGQVGAYAESFPQVYVDVLADLSVRFVGYAVTEPDEWATAVRLSRPDTAAVLQVMTWLSEQYTTAAPTPPPAPAPQSSVIDRAIASGPLAGKRVTSPDDIARIAGKFGGEVG